MEKLQITVPRQKKKRIQPLRTQSGSLWLSSHNEHHIRRLTPCTVLHRLGKAAHKYLWNRMASREVELGPPARERTPTTSNKNAHVGAAPVAAAVSFAIATAPM